MQQLYAAIRADDAAQVHAAVEAGPSLAMTHGCQAVVELLETRGARL